MTEDDRVLIENHGFSVEDTTKFPEIKNTKCVYCDFDIDAVNYYHVIRVFVCGIHYAHKNCFLSWIEE